MKDTSITKVAVLGAESTGKTWLCQKLAEHYRTMWVPEYAREYFNHSDIYNYTMNDLDIISGKQLEMEEAAETKARGFLFCDTAIITLKIWAELEFNACSPSILNRLTNDRYGLYLITGNDIEWEDDPLRQNRFSRDVVKEMNIKEVLNTGKPYTVITGSGQERLYNAIKAVDSVFR